MKFLLLFSPVVICMIRALISQYNRKIRVGFITLLLVTLVVFFRISLLALDLGGVEIGTPLRFLEMALSMYVVPTMYMFLCDQCGARWNNHQAIFMLVLPVLALVPTLSLVLNGEVVSTQVIENSLNVFAGGSNILHIHYRHTIIVIQCLIVAYCMGRLYFRVRKYGLKFTKPMVGYYVWMFTLLGFLVYSQCRGLDTSSDANDVWLMFVFYTLVIGAGYLFIPYSFKVAPIITEDEEEAVSLDSFVATNKHLVESLKKLFEEEKVFLKQSLHIDDLAVMMGTNRTYVTRLMRQAYNQTFNDFVNSARVEYSKNLLLSTEMSLEEVAATSGFPSASAYCRVFKKFTDTTPRSWKLEQS